MTEIIVTLTLIVLTLALLIRPPNHPSIAATPRQIHRAQKRNRADLRKALRRPRSTT